MEKIDSVVSSLRSLSRRTTQAILDRKLRGMDVTQEMIQNEAFIKLLQKTTLTDILELDKISDEETGKLFSDKIRGLSDVYFEIMSSYKQEMFDLHAEEEEPRIVDPILLLESPEIVREREKIEAELKKVENAVIFEELKKKKQAIAEEAKAERAKKAKAIQEKWANEELVLAIQKFDKEEIKTEITAQRILEKGAETLVSSSEYVVEKTKEDHVDYVNLTNQLQDLESTQKDLAVVVNVQDQAVQDLRVVIERSNDALESGINHLSKAKRKKNKTRKIMFAMICVALTILIVISLTVPLKILI